jgi:hypothetical protein
MTSESVTNIDLDIVNLVKRLPNDQSYLYIRGEGAEVMVNVNGDSEVLAECICLVMMEKETFAGIILAAVGMYMTDE